MRCETCGHVHTELAPVRPYEPVWNPATQQFDLPRFNLHISKRGNEHFATLAQAEAKLAELLPEYLTGRNTKFRVREADCNGEELKRLEIYHSGSGRVWHVVQLTDISNYPASLHALDRVKATAAFWAQFEATRATR